MEYNKNKTISHPIAIQHPCCIQDFNEVIKNEDDTLKTKQYSCIFISSVEVLNLDCAKNKEYPIGMGKERPKSMDITFAISENDKAEIVLVDFKLNIVNPNTLKKEDLEGKVNDSMLFLCNSIPIHNQYIFVLQPNKVQQARNRLQRMLPKIPNNYIAMDLSELINKYFRNTTIGIYGGVEVE